MKMVPKYNIGDLLVTNELINPYVMETEGNTYPVIGWITDIKMYYQNSLITYGVQWNDKNGEIIVSEKDIEQFVENYKALRRDHNIAK